MTITPEQRRRFSDIRARLEQGAPITPAERAWHRLMSAPMRRASHHAFARTCRWQDYRLTGRVVKQLAEMAHGIDVRMVYGVMRHDAGAAGKRTAAGAAAAVSQL